MPATEAKVSKEPWEEALKIFAASDAQDTHVPSRETITGIQWLKWDVYAKSRGLPDPKGWDFFASTETWWMEYWAVASANYEAFTPVMTKFYGNMDDIIESMQGYYNSNPVAQPWTFTRAFDAVDGTRTWLSDQAKKLDTQRNKVGKKGDDFQGTGAGAFRDVLDGLIFKCNDLVRQLGVRPDALKDAMEQKDDPKTAGTDESSGLKWAFAKLQEAHARWKSSEEFTRDTGKFGQLKLPGSQLAWPGGCLTAVWTSTAFKEDLSKARDDDWSGTGGERYPRSTVLGADARNPAFWNGIADVAQKLWLDHIKDVLDPVATTVLTNLPVNYNAAKVRLPQIREPRRLNLHKPPPTPPPGSQGPPPPTPPPGSGGPKPPPGSKDGPPKVPDPKDVKGPAGDKDKKGPGGAPPPPVPGPPKGGIKPPPAPPKPDAPLKVPSGSSVGPDGVVLGPDKKPLLDPLGRPIVVPPGSRVGPNGEILGPKGEKLAEKDRLARPEQTKKDESQQSELDKYLKSLRGGGTPSMPTLLGSHSPPVSFSSGGSSSLHNGLSAPKTSVGSVGTPSGLGAPGGHELPAPPEKPVTTEGGPSLIKNQQGTGTPQNGMGGVPFYPPTAGGAGAGAGAGGENKSERDRTTWLTEDEETWGTDPKLPPSVLGGRRRGGRTGGRTGGHRDYGQGGNDGRLAGGATSPGYGHAEGSA